MWPKNQFCLEEFLFHLRNGFMHSQHRTKQDAIAVDDLVHVYIKMMLTKYNGNVSKVARELGITRYLVDKAKGRKEYTRGE
jgi:ActR/RegA family two-component response regulator